MFLLNWSSSLLNGQFWRHHQHFLWPRKQVMQDARLWIEAVMCYCQNGLLAYRMTIQLVDSTHLVPEAWVRTSELPFHQAVESRDCSLKGIVSLDSWRFNFIMFSFKQSSWTWKALRCFQHLPTLGSFTGMNRTSELWLSWWQPKECVTDRNPNQSDVEETAPQKHVPFLRLFMDVFPRYLCPWRKIASDSLHVIKLAAHLWHPFTKLQLASTLRLLWQAAGH